MSNPVFEHVPILGDASKAKLKVAYLAGISTRHGAEFHDRGRLYATISSGSVELFSIPSRGGGSLVASGTPTTLGELFDLAEENSSGISGSAVLESFIATDATVVLLPTFAVDQDVLIDEEAASKLPGWDDEFGLAHIQAQSMRALMTDYLPSALPHLFGKLGLAAFVPQTASAELPDLRTLACPDQLRIAQASLTKAMSAEQLEHLEEFALIAKAARQRFAEAMERLAMANVQEQDEKEENDSPGPQATTWRRG